MNCPRCGSSKTKCELRKEGKGKKAVETNIVDERCLDCGWYGNHVKQVNLETNGPVVQR